MRSRFYRSGIGMAVAAGLALSAMSAWAQGSADFESQLQQNAEKLSLEGRRGPSLFQPGFGVGEYSGWAKSSAQHSNLAGIFTSDEASATIEVQRPGMAPVTGECGGGRSRLGLDWITFQRDPLTYVCIYGGSAPAGAEFGLAHSQGGGLFDRLTQPQRAGEFRYGPVILRAQTHYISGLPFGGGGAHSYVVFRPDGTAVAGLQTNGLRPVFWLPRAQGPERDAAAVLLLTLFSFQDPAKQSGGFPF